MAEVERLLVASQLRVAIIDPRQPVARHCLRAYFAELASRFDDGSTRSSATASSAALSQAGNTWSAWSFRKMKRATFGGAGCRSKTAP